MTNTIPHGHDRPIPLEALPTGVPVYCSPRVVIALFLLALFVRAALLAIGPWRHPPRSLQSDSHRYLVLAENLVAYQAFGKQVEDGMLHQAVARLRAENGTQPAADANGLRPESFRTPGYPMFLAAIEASGGRVRAILIVQCLLGAAMTPLVMAIASSLRLAPAGVCLVGLLWAVHPALILFDLLLLTESFFNCCAITGLAIATRVNRISQSLLAGVMIGLTSLVRPLGLLYLPAAAVLIWPISQRRIRSLIVMIAAAVAPVGLWALRNQSVGEGLRVSTIGDLHLLFQAAAYAISEERGEDWHGSWPERVRELIAKLETRVTAGADVFGECRRLAAEELAQRPLAVARVHAKSMVKLLLDHSFGDAAPMLGASYQPSGLFSRLILREDQARMGQHPTTIQLLIVLSWMALNGVIVVAALAGAIGAMRRRDYQLLFFCVPTIVLFMVASGSVGLERFRLPCLLPLLLLTGNLMPRRTAAAIPAA